MENKVFDCIIIGGGLAGLSLSILLAKKNYQVLLLEKKSYPYHKVCGEYISMESWHFIERLGIPLSKMNLPKIDTLSMTASTGQSLQQSLDMGGFGISRFTLDHLLAQEAKRAGVTLLENTICFNYKKVGHDLFQVETKVQHFIGKIVCASFGRHAIGNFYKPARQTENWIGVKYHIKGNFKPNEIALHTFQHGYCGISKINDETFCLCYLAKASLLKKHNNQLADMEKEVLQKNPFLAAIFQQATFVFDKPITISNVTFSSKQPVFDDVFYLGDAAGSIAPLSGNGMSNALRASFLLHSQLDSFFKHPISFTELKKNYARVWKKTFHQRISASRIIQYFFCQPSITPRFISIMRMSETLRKFVIKQTHGERF
jgi:menaquinone-9 beta-reductase